jgi:hypothetical protein
MQSRSLSAVHDEDLLKLLTNLDLIDKLGARQLKCKFTDTIITFDNLYSIFPESGDIKLVCDSPEAIKLFSDYVNDHKFAVA